MADISKISTVDIANIAKVSGVDIANIANIYGADAPAPEPTPFTLYLRERQRYVALFPAMTFSKSGASEVQGVSTTASLGEAIFFANFTRAYLDGKKIRIEWDGATSFQVQTYKCVVVDGAYDRTVNGDWNIANSDNFWVGSAGNGLLDTIDDQGAPFDVNTTYGPLDLSGGSLTDCCLAVFMGDANSSTDISVRIQALEILNPGDDSILQFANVSDDVIMEQTGGTSDYGYLGVA
jgi:hypothetical protein